jgi:hypothetical protein
MAMVRWLAAGALLAALGCAAGGATGGAPAGTPAPSPGGDQTPSRALGINFSNRTGTPVNVSVVVGTTEIFLRQVSANTSEHIPVQGVAAGIPVTLRATTLDGMRVYSRDVTLDGTVSWQIP